MLPDNDVSREYYHSIIDDRHIKDAAKRVEVLFRIEDLIELYSIEKELLFTEIRIEGLIENRVGTVRVYGENIFSDCGYRERFKDVEIIFNCSKGGSYTLQEVYRTLGVKMAKTVINYLKRYLFYEREYLMMILIDGTAVILEGFQSSITFPSIEGVIFIAHTHPRTRQPIFSRKDLISTLDVISKRGIGSCIIASEALCILREKPFTLEDYEKFEHLIGKFGVATRDVLDMAEFKSVYILGI